MLTEEFNNTFINTFCAAEHIFCCDLLLSWLNPWFDTIHTDKRMNHHQPAKYGQKSSALIGLVMTHLCELHLIVIFVKNREFCFLFSNYWGEFFTQLSFKCSLKYEVLL